MIQLIYKRSYSISWNVIEGALKRMPESCSCVSFPSDMPIDFQSDLNYTSAIPSKHLMCLTTKDNRMESFESNIEDWKDTLAYEMQKFKHLYKDQRVSVSSVVFENHQQILNKYKISEEQLVFLYPDNKAIKFSLSNTQEFIMKYLHKQQTQEVYNPFKKTKTISTDDKIQAIDPTLFKEYPIEKDLILTCGHAKRDIRCGIMGPILQNEFNSKLNEVHLSKTVYNGQITHIGGHKFAGNVLYYPKEAKTSKDFIWYGRVFSEDVDLIVNETIKKKNIVKELFRGPIGDYQ